MKIVSLNRQYFQPCRVWLGAALLVAGVVGLLHGADLAAQAKHQCGLALFRQGQWDRAREVFASERKAKGGPNLNAPPTELDRLISACDTKTLPVPAGSVSIRLCNAPTLLNKLEGQVATADTFFAAGQHAKAARLYERIMHVAPGSEVAGYALMQTGRCYNQLRQYRRALQCYNQFADKYQTSSWAADALIRAGVIYVGPLRDQRAGIRCYQLILDRYPTCEHADRAQFYIATLSYWRKDWKEALAEYEQLVTRFPQSRFSRQVSSTILPEIREKLNLQESKG